MIKSMQKSHEKNYTSSFILSTAIVLIFVILAFASTIPFDELSEINSKDQVYAGSQEATDNPIRTNIPTESPLPSEFDDFEASPIVTPSPSISPSLIAFTSPSIAPTPSSGFDDFFNSPIPTPTQSSAPIFDTDTDDTNSSPAPQPTPTAVVAGQNNNLIILGVIGGVVILLVVIGIILLRKSKENNPPPTYPTMPPNGNLPPTPEGPKYPPYINQQ